MVVVDGWGEVKAWCGISCCGIHKNASVLSHLYCRKRSGEFSFISVCLLAASSAGLGRSFGPDATLASLTLCGLLGLSGLLHRGLG